MKKLCVQMWIGLLALLLSAVSACHVLDEDERDECQAVYKVQFVADMNLNFADAFEQEVSAIRIFIYDDQYSLVRTIAESGDALRPESGKFKMALGDLAPGVYHLVAWGGLDESNAFTVPDLEDRSVVEDLTCTLTRSSRADGPDVVDYELDDLYHGMIDIEIPEVDTPGEHLFSIQLTKDTNSVTVVLQELDSTPMEADDYDVIITANNGHLNYDNSLINDEQPFTYSAWSVESSSASLDTRDTGDEEPTGYSTIVARMTTSRLVLSDWSTDTRPILTITNNLTGERVLSIPLIDYALMVRSNYTRVTDSQDYLDRQGDYNITFFLVHGRWLNTQIIINDWVVRLQDDTVY
jgi:hypothetical protein